MSKKKSIWCVVLVVNYGSHELIARNFSTLPRREDGVAMVVVDNFSTEAERREIRALCEERGWDLVTSGINLGFGTGVNLGVDYALDLDPETIVLLNPDAVIDASRLRQLADAVREDEQRLVCPRIEDTAGKVFFAGALLDMQTGGTLGASSPKRRADGVYREWLTGACLAFAPSLWRKLGDSPTTISCTGKMSTSRSARCTPGRNSTTRRTSWWSMTKVEPSKPADNGPNPRCTTTTTSATGCCSLAPG